MHQSEILKVIIDSTGVSIDTRTMIEGNVFFAISGDNFDGNDYVEKALEKGAVLAISSEKRFWGIDRVVVVEDVLKTMQNLANSYRMLFDIPILAITGTNGKTTTKELICTVLSGKYNVLCTKGNFNNHIGVPLTLFRLNKNHEIGVVEMGANFPGEIDFLCRIAEPTFGLITSIGKAHIQGFGSLGNIIKTKLELYHYIYGKKGTFFYNKAIEDLKEYIEKGRLVEEFDSEAINGKNFKKIKLLNSFPTITLNYQLDNGEENDGITKLYGGYNFDNIVAAVKVGDYFDVEKKIIQKKLASYTPDNNRSQIINWRTNTVILDAYNANPTSMLGALNSFIGIKTDKKKTIILGDMLELGEISTKEHEKIIKFILSNNQFENILLIGAEFFKAKNKIKESNSGILYLKSNKIAKEKLEEFEIENSLILTKGSRGIALENIF